MRWIIGFWIESWEGSFCCDGDEDFGSPWVSLGRGGWGRSPARAGTVYAGREVDWVGTSSVIGTHALPALRALEVVNRSVARSGLES